MNESMNRIYLTYMSVSTSDLKYCTAPSHLAVISYIRAMWHASKTQDWVPIPMSRLALLVEKAPSTIKYAVKHLRDTGVLVTQTRGPIIEAKLVDTTPVSEGNFYSVRIPINESYGEGTTDVEEFTLRAMQCIQANCLAQNPAQYDGIFNAPVYLESWVPAKKARISRALDYLTDMGYITREKAHTTNSRNVYMYKVLTTKASAALENVKKREGIKDPEPEKPKVKRGRRPKEKKPNDYIDGDGLIYVEDPDRKSDEQVMAERKADALHALGTAEGQAALEAHKHGAPLPSWVRSAMEDAGMPLPEDHVVEQPTRDIAAMFEDEEPIAEPEKPKGKTVGDLMKELGIRIPGEE